jgi:hypothetical protein
VLGGKEMLKIKLIRAFDLGKPFNKILWKFGKENSPLSNKKTPKYFSDGFSMGSGTANVSVVLDQQLSVDSIYHFRTI